MKLGQIAPQIIELEPYYQLVSVHFGKEVIQHE